MTRSLRSTPIGRPLLATRKRSGVTGIFRGISLLRLGLGCRGWRWFGAGALGRGLQRLPVGRHEALIAQGADRVHVLQFEDLVDRQSADAGQLRVEVGPGLRVRTQEALDPVLRVNAWRDQELAVVF